MIFKDILCGLLVAAFLSYFSFDVCFVDALQPILPFEVNTGTYFITFALLGVISYIFRNRRK